jgi:hypothetical protein
VAVLPNVLSAEECKHVYDQTWETIEMWSKNFTADPKELEIMNREYKMLHPESKMQYKPHKPILRNDPSTYESFGQFDPLHGMLFKIRGSGYSKPAVFVRNHVNVHAAYAAIYDEDNLLSSFDGMSFRISPTKKEFKIPTNATEFMKTAWPHFDCGFGDPDDKNRNLVQGFVDILGTEPGAAAFTFLEGSHKHFNEFGRRFGKKSSTNWIKFTEDEVKWLIEEKGCKPVSVTCPPGSMVFWYSQNAHWGMGPTDQKLFNRLVFYVCMAPREWATEKQLAEKRNIVLENRTTSHNPIYGTRNPLGSRCYDELRHPINFEHFDIATITNPRQRMLYGF